ncbi:S1C family serine protease [soil metagenome]
MFTAYWCMSLPESDTPPTEPTELVSTGLPDVLPEADPAPKRGLRRLTWLLFTLLVTVFSLSFTAPFKPHIQTPRNGYVYYHASQSLPDVVLPSGSFSAVFDQTRPATLRIEARSPAYLTGPIGVGTGFFISDDGFVLTANHVVDRSEIDGNVRAGVTYIGVSPDNTEYTLELVGYDAYSDLALLKAEVLSDVAFLPLATATPKVGSDIIAIGNSRGAFLEGRAGRISRLGVASPRARFAKDTIELTAALSPGDSGGPIINAQGEAVGVVSYISFQPNALGSPGDSPIPEYLRPIIVPQRGFASYAVPVLASSEELLALRAGERNDIPVVGLTLSNDYDPGRSSVDLGPRAGAVVQNVQPGGPAAKAGFKDLQVNRERQEIARADIITEIDSEPVRTVNDLFEVLYRKQVGQTVTVTVQRGGDTFKLRLVLGAKQDVFR